MERGATGGWLASQARGAVSGWIDDGPQKLGRKHVKDELRGKEQLFCQSLVSTLRSSQLTSPCPVLTSAHNLVASRRGEQCTSFASILVQVYASTSSDTHRPRPRPRRTTLMISSRNCRAALAIRDHDKGLLHPPLASPNPSTIM
jgi:hypothetical protein